MRRIVIAALCAAEGLLLVGIVASSLAIASSFERGDGLRRVGQVMLSTTHALTRRLYRAARTG